MLRVSRLLSSLRLSPDPSWFTTLSQERGVAVHAIAEAVFQGQPIDVAPQYAGYRLALERAAAALDLEVLAVERRLTSAADGLTGRPDLLAVARRRVGTIPAGPVIVDVKSGMVLPSHALQLGLYERLILAADLPWDLRGFLVEAPWTRVGLYVRPTGDYKITVYDDPIDRLLCSSLLDIARWRARHGLDRLTLDDLARDPAVPEPGHAAP